jgi:hypothetical protein
VGSESEFCGAGAHSDAAFAQAAAALRSSRILLDSICIGNSDFSVLKALSLSTGGYCFKPRRLRDALKLNEVGWRECTVRRWACCTCKGQYSVARWESWSASAHQRG